MAINPFAPQNREQMLCISCWECSLLVKVLSPEKNKHFGNVPNTSAHSKLYPHYNLYTMEQPCSYSWLLWQILYTISANTVITSIQTWPYRCASHTKSTHAIVSGTQQCTLSSCYHMTVHCLLHQRRLIIAHTNGHTHGHAEVSSTCASVSSHGSALVKTISFTNTLRSRTNPPLMSFINEPPEPHCLYAIGAMAQCRAREE